LIDEATEITDPDLMGLVDGQISNQVLIGVLSR
jgi:hypothetical protein